MEPAHAVRGRYVEGESRVVEHFAAAGVVTFPRPPT